MTGINLVSGTPDLAALLAAGDIQGAIQLVMGNRVQLLDAQLAQQIQAVQDRNDQISQLNDLLSKLTAYEGGISGSDANSTFKHDSSYTADMIKQEAAVNDAVKATGVDLGTGINSGQATGPNGTPVAGSSVTGGVDWTVTKGQLDAAITKVKGLIDTASNNQQMDMLRLQSLNNKRDEAFDLLTNTQKSYHDTTSGIVRNF